MALLLSLGLHVLPALLPRLVPPLLLRPPITVEILPARLKPPAEDNPNRDRKGAAPPAQPKGPGPARKRPPALLPAEPVADLASDDPSVAVILRMAPLRTSPHRPLVEALLAAFPDARLLQSGDPAALARRLIDDTEALLITTTNPRLLTATALIAVHGEGVELMPAAPRPTWEPRRIERLGPAITAYGSDETLRHFADPAAQARLLKLVRAPGRPAVSADLRHLDRFIIVEGGSLPAPRSLRLALTADERPTLRLVLELSDPEEAARWTQTLPEVLAQVRDQIRFFGLAPLIDALSVSSNGTTVEVRGRLPQAESDLLMQIIRIRLALLPLPVDMPSPDMSGP